MGNKLKRYQVKLYIDPSESEFEIEACDTSAAEKELKLRFITGGIEPRYIITEKKEIQK